MRSYYLILVYRPPSGNYKVALELIDSVLDQVNRSNSRQTTIICGDLNIDLSSKQLKPEKTSLINLCREYNLLQCIKVPTRCGRTKNSILDLIITDSLNISICGTVNYNISDHLPVYIVIKKHKEHYSKVTFRRRSYSSYDKDSFQLDLRRINWGRFYGTSDINEAWEIFYSHLLNTCNVHTPVKSFSIRKNCAPWFSDKVTEMSLIVIISIELDVVLRIKQ